MTPTPIQTSAERLEKDRVKLRVEVDESALRPALDSAYRRWAGEIKVPGFRKGKVPRQIIDARVGPEAVREEALRDALPTFYREAMQAEQLEAIAPPDIEVLEFETGSPLVFEATVDVRPEIQLPDISTIEVEAAPSEVTDEEVSAQLDRLRDRFAELETASREARRGDYALIDLKGYVNDELLEGASAPDFLYEVGSRTGPPKLDEELEGNRAGAILKFTDTLADGPHAGEEVTFTVLLKEVKAKKLPPLDDEFAKTVGEFESLSELEDDLRSRMAELKKQLADDETRTRVLRAVVDASDLEPPEKLVEGEFQHRLEHMEADLKRAGMTIDDYAEHAGITELELRRDLRADATRSVKAELLLEQIARDQEISVAEEEIGREVAVAAARAERDAKEVAEQVVKQGRLPAIAADIMRRKALDYLVQAVKVTGREAEVEQ